MEAVEKQLGVTLGPLKKNAGKKAVYKLSCNSLWGKMGQRPNMPKNHYTKSIGEFQKFVRQAPEPRAPTPGKHDVEHRAQLELRASKDDKIIH